MREIVFLGGSGYVCNSFKNKKFNTDKQISFYSRSSINICKKYEKINELPNSEIIFDLSQWANGDDIEKLGFQKMKKSIMQAIKKCDYYIFISTVSIDINSACNYENEKYSNSKLIFEKFILSDSNKNCYVLRIPACFNQKPKEGTLIDLLFKRINGSKKNIKQPYKFTTGINTEDLFYFFEKVIQNPNSIANLFGGNRLLCLGDGYAYRILELEEFIKNSLNKSLNVQEKFVFPEKFRINLQKHNNWYLHKVSFPVKILRAIQQSQKE